MFIREVKKKRSKTSKTFYQYSLVQASRIEGKVKQTIILYLGSDTQLRDKEDRAKVLQALKALIFAQPEIFPLDIPSKLESLARSYFHKYTLKYGDQQTDGAAIPPRPDRAEYLNVDLLGMEVSDVRSFGAEHLCAQVLDKLQLLECLQSVGIKKYQARKAVMAIAARAIFCSSEHRTAQILKMNSSLTDCFDIDEQVSHKQLYHISDLLFEHKAEIDRFLHQRITHMFNLKDTLVIFDLSNTYFETGKRGSSIAKYGRSKEKRNDCPIVVFAGAIGQEGFIRHSRNYEGNLPDPEALAMMISDLEQHSDHGPKKTIVMDAGIATEDNLSMLREKGYDYVCVSRKRLKKYPCPQPGKVTRLTDRGHQKVELSVFKPEDQPDTWMSVQSQSKRAKEQSISKKLSERFEQEMESVKAAIGKKGGTKKIEKVWKRIGRAEQKHIRVSGRYQVEVDQKDGLATDIKWERKVDPVKEDKENGVYFIRTSYTDPSESELWDIYNTIRQVESTFRCLKSDLNIRPVHHQKDERIQAHLYLTILAYQLVNTIRYMLAQQGIHHQWTNILRIMSTQHIQTVELPTDKKVVHLRKPSKPIEEVQKIYSATSCTDTQKVKRKYVVYH